MTKGRAKRRAPLNPRIATSGRQLREKGYTKVNVGLLSEQSAFTADFISSEWPLLVAYVKKLLKSALSLKTICRRAFGALRLEEVFHRFKKERNGDLTTLPNGKRFQRSFESIKDIGKFFHNLRDIVPEEMIPRDNDIEIVINFFTELYKIHSEILLTVGPEAERGI